MRRDHRECMVRLEPTCDALFLGRERRGVGQRGRVALTSPGSHLGGLSIPDVERDPIVWGESRRSRHAACIKIDCLLPDISH